MLPWCPSRPWGTRQHLFFTSPLAGEVAPTAPERGEDPTLDLPPRGGGGAEGAGRGRHGTPSPPRASYRRNAGSKRAHSTHPTTHSTPPDTTDTRTLKKDATLPDSK